MPGDVGKILDKTVAAKIKWDNQNSYDQLEMVAVKCPDGAIKYGCIYKKIDIWLVEYKNSYKSEAFEILDTENIGKNY